ncbi:calcium/sodium antiporter [Halobaculum sp. D14]|uniref:calcium/sodium antiporter n=1 Tax=Halobaculum sp. D14 TaxID=3421642 RepID=UPI003EB84B1B
MTFQLLGTALPLYGTTDTVVELLTGDAGIALLLGVVLLYVGAESLVKGASNLSVGLGMRAAVAGVTVVAFATSAPELAVGVLSGLDFGTTLGLGAIVGSNIANIGLVLGLSALIRPLDVAEETVRRHVPFMALAAVLLVGFGLDGTVGRFDAAVFLVALAGFTYVLFTATDDGDADLDVAVDADADDSVATDGGATAEGFGFLANRDIRLHDLAFVAVGLLLLLVGARRLISGGQTFLYYLGFGDRFVGLTVLALGTSLPELAASVVSAIRGEADFSVGNVVGSNIYNVLAVLGVLGLMTPISVPAGTSTFDFPILVGFTGGAIVLMLRNRELTRVDGVVLLAGYALFVHFLL